jgi:ammonia channel protein AmtB
MIRKPRPVFGMVIGFLGGSLFSAIALVLYSVRGEELFERLGTSLPNVLLIYHAGGAVAGLVVGLLLPLTIWRWGAVIVGILGAIPVYFGAGMVMGDLDLTLDLAVAVVVGGIVGYSWYSPPTGGDSDQEPQAPIRSTD